MKIEIVLDVSDISVGGLATAINTDEIGDTQECYNEAIREYVEGVLLLNINTFETGVKVLSVDVTEEHEWSETPLLGPDWFRAMYP